MGEHRETEEADSHILSDVFSIYTTVVQWCHNVVLTGATDMRMQRARIMEGGGGLAQCSRETEESRL